ncbi:DUF5060 domain-containing protein [Pelagicoccus sp. SDUM812003]|uniref:DUF5060 domain-containing protein n=1 Tax=Pelagicoccus sp. SDUM812003 TaxID=3041267 RepID=UPI00280F5E40|nr:DUF5060 domain-containing protein [Pelagicoccus sp. SDUM812003]MDQ8201438.1 DUF5060 domain-containing protein [Pelagicoccus sp. SDUM812003]
MKRPTIIRIAIAVILAHLAIVTSARAETVKRWHTLELSFTGPQSSETAELNPFTDYRLQVEFVHAQSRYIIRGFYAADGNAAETGAVSGNQWKVRFTPDQPGEWRYKASLCLSPMIAIDPSRQAGKQVPLSHAEGSFQVLPRDVEGRDFRSLGRLSARNGYFYFAASDRYWIKGGAGSPENLLGYQDFDGTYRYVAEARDGEASADEKLHVFAPHLQDWQEGDPTWRDGKGKGLIGGINYLASKGVNSIYFLTMNIDGDGKDVWPYLDHHTRDRFDCSKLDQWEIAFRHLQEKGILLHVVTQETENELLLDDGETGPLRKLYYSELIARFGHHLALVWNLGEENGPVHWSPRGQSADQQKAMADFIDRADPYQHPIVLHTHSTAHEKYELLTPLLGHRSYDGMSFQIDRREQAHSEIIKWKNLADSSDHPWLITFDEQGKWHRGVLPDTDDPDHDTIRRYALWGSLMGGAAGIEWYFGAHYAHNDLSLEDWRSRDRIWDLTRFATVFFHEYLPFSEMASHDELTPRTDDYCFAKPGEIYAIYSPDSITTELELGSDAQRFSIRWYDPLQGGGLQEGSVLSVSGLGLHDLGEAPKTANQDWVILVRRD